MSLKLFLAILIMIPFVVLVLVFKTGLSQNFQVTNNSITPTPTSSSVSAVTVSAEYLPARSSADFIVFQVSLNTHSVDLDGIDFQKSVILEKSGQKFSPLEVAVDGSDHHRETSVKFNRVSAPIKMIFLETPEVNRQEFEFKEL